VGSAPVIARRARWLHRCRSQVLAQQEDAVGLRIRPRHTCPSAPPSAGGAPLPVGLSARLSRISYARRWDRRWRRRGWWPFRPRRERRRSRALGRPAHEEPRLRRNRRNWSGAQYLPGADPDFDVVYAIRPRSAMAWRLEDYAASQRRWSSW